MTGAEAKIKITYEGRTVIHETETCNIEKLCPGMFSCLFSYLNLFSDMLLS